MNPVQADREARRDPKFRSEGDRHDDRPSRNGQLNELPDPERSEERNRQRGRR